MMNMGGVFVDSSGPSGLDHPGDGRGLALVDWDQDGDLDIWWRDRTAPRLRLTLNAHATAGARDYVAVRLVGRECNRDAIGAVVEVRTEGEERLVRSVRAGDLFLSQSSRVLHFGLGPNTKIKGVKVLWPGGKTESFSNVGAGEVWLLEQGKGKAVKVERKSRQIQLGVKVSRKASGATRVVLPTRLPLPPLDYTDERGQRQRVVGGGAPRLIILWSAECAHCLRELPKIVEQAGAYRVAGLPVLEALNVDGAGQRAEAGAVMQSCRWPFSWGVLEERSKDRIDVFQQALFDVTVPLSVPTAFLLSPRGDLVAIYRGTLDPGAVKRDLKELGMASAERLHELAPPLAGRWFTKPVDPVYALEFMAGQFEDKLRQEALLYLGLARERASDRHTRKDFRDFGSDAKTPNAARKPE